MSEYLDLIKIYYNEKQIFLLNDKHKKCSDCENNKQFIENNKELIFNCGGSGKNCGDKIKIILPIYKNNYNLNLIKENINKSINWKVISEYIKIDADKIQQNDKLKEDYENELNSIKDLFKKYNNKNINIINENYQKILELKKQLNIILIEMKLPENSSNIKELKKQYINIIDNINNLTRDIKVINNDIEYYFMIEEPRFDKKEYKHEQPSKKKKKAKDKVDVVEDTLKKGDEVKWMSGNKELIGKIDNITSKSYMICCKPDGKMYRVKKELVSLNIEEPVKEESKETKGPDEETKGPDEEEPQEEDPGEEPQEEEPEETKGPDEEELEEETEGPVEITTGSKVKWSKGGKEFNGDVENITSKSYIICCKPDGKKYRVPKELVSLV